MKQEDYDVDYFLNFFGAIPEDRDKWCGGMWFDGNSGYCALGHCGVAFSDDIDKLPVAMALVALFGGKITDVTRVSDGDDPNYQQPTPKARILAALHDIKRQQEQAEKNLRQSSTERGTCLPECASSSTTSPVPTGRGNSAVSEPPQCGVSREVRPLPQSLSPITAELAKHAPCYHLPIFGTCVYCGCAMPVEKVEVGV